MWSLTSGSLVFVDFGIRSIQYTKSQYYAYFCAKVTPKGILNKYMSDHNKTFNAFVKLGGFLRDFRNSDAERYRWAGKLELAVTAAGHKNGWFNTENILFALANWGELLREEKLAAWLSPYRTDQNEKSGPRAAHKNVALIMAGNIPLVGFHDFLSVLITGHGAMIKLSSNDDVLLPCIADFLIAHEPNLAGKIKFVEGRIEGFDAVIATGSNNTARYFEHYFGKGPNIIRKNRNSVAVLTGTESTEQLRSLGHDIFRYYGLGCRSVSKLFVPEEYDFDTFFESIYSFRSLIDQVKYANNYDYNKAVYLMSEFKLLDNGFLILKEDESHSSPIASVFYERYSSISALRAKLEKDRDRLQCVVASGLFKEEVPFGETQTPALSDYADGIDTVDFLLKI